MSAWGRAKRLKDELAREREADLEFVRKVDRIVSKRPGVPSKVSNPKTRSDEFDDRKILRKISASVRRGSDVALTGSRSRVVRAERRSTSISSEERIETIYVRNWDHSSPIMKSLAYGAAMAPHRRYALTLKLTPEVIRTALSSPKGFVSFMQDRLSRHLRRSMGGEAPVFAITVERADLESFHLHGAIECPDGEKAVRGLKNVLAKVGGEMSGAAKARQVDLRRMHNLAGWFDYVAKARLVTEENLRFDRARHGLPPIQRKEGLVAAPIALRRAGKAWFEEARRSEAPLLRRESARPDRDVSLV